MEQENSISDHRTVTSDSGINKSWAFKPVQSTTEILYQLHEHLSYQMNPPVDDGS